MSAPRTKKAEVYYPESDGKPMAETDLHRDRMVDNIQILKKRFAGQRVYVSGNLLVYYVEGDPKYSVAPDTFVVKDCNPGRRRIFKIWEEKRVPCFVMETTSKKTRREDQNKKAELYASLGVAEYLLYDPLGEWLDPPLIGYRLIDGQYARIEPDARGGIVSEELGITFRVEGGDLVLYDTATGERLLTDAERAAEAEAGLAQAAAARMALEEELARLRAKTSG